MLTRTTIAKLACLPVVLGSLTMLTSTGCSTAPKSENKATVVSESRATTSWFKTNVAGLDRQLDGAAGYVSFPAVGQYGILIGGGKFGRGVVYDANGTQVGWAYINTASAGLQVGVQGYKMLMVFEDAATMGRFKENKLTGNVGATAVAADAGRAGQASFTDGVAIYQGAQTGLMAGASIGLDLVRYEAR